MTHVSTPKPPLPSAESIFIAIYIDDILVLVKDKDAATNPDNNSILYTYQPNRQAYNFWGIRILISPPIDGQLPVILLFLTGLLYIQQPLKIRNAFRWEGFSYSRTGLQGLRLQRLAKTKERSS